MSENSPIFPIFSEKSITQIVPASGWGPIVTPTKLRSLLNRFFLLPQLGIPSLIIINSTISLGFVPERIIDSAQVLPNEQCQDIRSLGKLPSLPTGWMDPVFPVSVTWSAADCLSSFDILNGF